MSGSNTFKRVLVANRGEVASRIISACQKLGIQTVAVFSEADRHSPHLKNADHTVCIGPGQSGLSYLHIENILQAAINNDCQAVHPGFGFLAENNIFAAMCEQNKLTFIGPSSRSIRLMGNKSEAKRMIKKAGIEVIPGTDGDIASLNEAITTSTEIGFPVLLKATSGGGGKGIRICKNKTELRNNYFEAKNEAEKAFGDDSLYLEKMILNGRHIEFQILADSYGNVIHLGERDCSIQRKNQKLIEESPSPALEREIINKTGRQITEAIRKLEYVNAGTVEFLLDGDRNLYFMEMNTRLQVEHPVSEMITGFDIVAEQISIAANNHLSSSQKNIIFNGHAIECRINAEDPDNDFLPSPGRIIKFNPSLHAGPGKIRIETHVTGGYEIPSFYDSMICKVIALGQNRKEAIETMVKSLKEFEIEGIKTTIPLHLKILDHPDFLNGNYHTGTLNNIIASN